MSYYQQTFYCVIVGRAQHIGDRGPSSLKVADGVCPSSSRADRERDGSASFLGAEDARRQAKHDEGGEPREG